MDREDFSEALLDAAPDDDLASLDRAVLNAGDRLPLDDFDALLALRNQDNLTKQLRDRIDRHLQKRFPDQLTALATTLLYDRQPQMSALSPLSSWQRATLLILPALGMVGIIFFPEITAKTALCILFLYCIASTTLKGALMLASSKPAQKMITSPLTRTPVVTLFLPCLLYTSPSPRDRQKSRMPSSA